MIFNDKILKQTIFIITNSIVRNTDENFIIKKIKSEPIYQI